MICVDCRQAGRALTDGLRKEAINALHGCCRGGTWCDCMHQLTSGLNLQRINAATMDKKDELSSSE